MRFFADLHIHSKHSRATSRDLDLEHLAYWAGLKGIGVIATGDFTHPAWLAELKEKLKPAEPGLFQLARDVETRILEKLPPACRQPVRFMLSVEISTIYKKGERTRKIHHLLYAPDFPTADRMVARLSRIGNLAADGRPILGLDSRDLLEITLESGPDAYLVPAHIWTPWFAVLGSQSGFNSIAACYGDLADHIFAAETGLSSDPAMNWRVSFLDRYRLTSNSDAHSPTKLGREATAFESEMDYFSIRRALETGEGYGGTVEFFPEEGKYHLDGHRRCGVRLEPQETRAKGGRCPVCGEPVTVGVLHRLEMLADRSEKEVEPPPTAGPVARLVPLPEILAEITGSGPASKTVAQSYDRLIGKIGPELDILSAAPIEDIARASSSLLAEAIERLRAGRVIREAGYDGEYGAIRLFDQAELKRRSAGGLLFELPAAPDDKLEASKPPPAMAGPRDQDTADLPALRSSSAFSPISTDPLAGLDAEQRKAAECINGPVLIIAGPGSGKTRTLAHRIGYLVKACNADPAQCLAVTFTRRAAQEMKERLSRLIPDKAPAIPVHTFHSLGLLILREHADAAGLPPAFRIATEAERLALLAEALGTSARKARKLLKAISRAKRTGAQEDSGTTTASELYGEALARARAIDFDDLVSLPVRMLETDPALAAHYRDRFPWISVDEFQDIDFLQYRLLKLLAYADGSLCVIGDPNQAIYGFRGADASVFERFRQDYPAATTVTLRRNYRSSGTIVAASSQVIAYGRDFAADSPAIALSVRGMEERVTVHAAPTERAEAEFVVATIEQAIGGHSFFSIDSGRAASARRSSFSFSDFAVLYRMDAQAAALVEAFARSGIPFTKHTHEPLSDKPFVRALMGAGGRLATEMPGCSLRALLAAAAGQLEARGARHDAAAAQTALEQLLALSALCGEDFGRLAEMVALATDADCLDPRADRVSLLTLHAAKGLEFPVVFIVGLEEGILPLRWGAADPAALAEERRLFYVGMTRAKERLVLSRAWQRRWRGRLRALSPSPFLADIKAALLEHRRAEIRRRRSADQLELF